MYRVTIINNGVETLIHSPNTGGLKLSSGVIKKEINLIDSFNFSFHMNSPGFNKIRPLQTLINVLNMRTGKYEFEGRILGPSKNMDNNGLHRDSYVCEGELGYLHDSVQRHLEFRGTPKELFTQIINYHNTQVESYKHFQVGNMTVTNSTNNLYLYLSAEKDTFETLKEKLLDKLGGELQIRKKNGVRFLDYLPRIGEDKTTEIRIAKNLVSMSYDIDPTNIITRLTPLGTRIKSENDQATDASEARLTIREINNGIDYIDSPQLIKEFGVQGGSVTWDDVTIASNLFSKGREWLSNQKTAHVQYKISALDLFLIGLDIDSFEPGNSYPVKNPIMGIDENLRVIGKSLDINSPQGASLTIGDKFKTLNQYQNDLKKSTQSISDLQETVFKQSNRISSLSTSLGEAKKELQTLKASVGEVDLQNVLKSVSKLEETLKKIEDGMKDLPTAENIMQINQDIELINSSVTNIDTKIDTIEKNIGLNNKIIEKVQSDIQLLANRVSSLEEGTGGV
ncbi:phage tail protein [Bacillus wiedmannii]|uniref:phage tail spike protein n=1 Tax=Bacillus wiedmannii TaxID=1890302 RepID=UPI001E4B275D|nr:phage tail spike protein [Bacillus wiedmannii]MCC2381212.1 phage tail protein [Bacillus wiedmannii]MCC2425553.1 phage tail protein [Bacillus wiedmannii]